MAAMSNKHIPGAEAQAYNWFWWRKLLIIVFQLILDFRIAYWLKLILVQIYTCICWSEFCQLPLDYVHISRTVWFEDISGDKYNKEVLESVFCSTSWK
jgi:hypothetical protein